jgi:hypothetical protein
MIIFSPIPEYWPDRISILACFITVVLGLYGRNHDNHFSSISKMMQNTEIAALYDTQSSDADPLDKNISRRRIRLVKDGKAERFSLESKDTIRDGGRKPFHFL